MPKQFSHPIYRIDIDRAPQRHSSERRHAPTHPQIRMAPAACIHTYTPSPHVSVAGEKRLNKFAQRGTIRADLLRFEGAIKALAQDTCVCASHAPAACTYNTTPSAMRYVRCMHLTWTSRT